MCWLASTTKPSTSPSQWPSAEMTAAVRLTSTSPFGTPSRQGPARRALPNTARSRDPRSPDRRSTAARGRPRHRRPSRDPRRGSLRAGGKRFHGQTRTPAPRPGCTPARSRAVCRLCPSPAGWAPAALRPSSCSGWITRCVDALLERVDNDVLRQFTVGPVGAADAIADLKAHLKSPLHADVSSGVYGRASDAWSRHDEDSDGTAAVSAGPTRDQPCARCARRSEVERVCVRASLEVGALDCSVLRSPHRSASTGRTRHRGP